MKGYKGNVFIHQQMETEYSRTRTEINNLIEELKNQSISVLPTEKQLVGKLKIGRNTLRKVVGNLVDEGLLERIQGKGTFIVNASQVLTFSNWISSELSPDRFMEILISRFESMNEKVHVRDLAIPYYQYVDKLFDLILRGKSPDVIQMNSYWLRRFQKLKMFLPLDGYVGPQFLKRNHSTALSLGRIKNEIVALNWTLDPLVIYCNKVVLEKAGLDPQKKPGTLDELAEMSIRVKESGKGLHGFCLPFEMYEHSFMCLYPFLLAFNGGFSDTIGNVILDSQENVKALTWLAAFYERGGVRDAMSINDARILFASDKLAFLIEGPAGRGNFRQISGLGEDFDRHYDIARMPVGPSGKSESVLLSHALAISKTSKDPASAYRWIEYLTTDESNAQLYFRLFGMIPCNRTVLHDAFFSKDPFASVLIQQLETAVPGPLDHPLFLPSIPFLIRAFSQIVLNRITVQEGLRFVREAVSVLSQTDSFGIH
jgi:multiple sugar transport system substrate-binding protein